MQTSTGVVAFGRNEYDIDGQTSNCLEYKNVVKGKQGEMLLWHTAGSQGNAQLGVITLS